MLGKITVENRGKQMFKFFVVATSHDYFCPFPKTDIKRQQQPKRELVKKHLGGKIRDAEAVGVIMM